ncbi:MAG: branched-chain amino acid ABC transporter substrate-binding protein [Chloroflexota bacterium]|nr:branched-chain amino acid ABC transporter substrate-binding protein [Chloroflexota bacterium]
MVDRRFNDLLEQLRHGRLDRRTFTVRAAALGVSASAIGVALMRGGVVAAQDATPAASPASGGGGGTELTPENLGVPGSEHSTDTSKGTINIYSSWPLTGASAQVGPDSVESIRYALEIYGNAAGGFALNYEALDDGLAANNGAWDATKEAENATMVVNDEDAMVYIATYNSGAAAISIPILNEADPGPMPMISPANTAVALTKDYEFNEEGQPEQYYPTGVRNYMRVVPADDIQGAASANWAYTTMGITSAYVLHDNQLYGKGVATVFERTFTELGGEVLGFEAFNPEADDYQSLMTSIADTAPGMVYLGAIVNLNASKLLQDMRSVMSVEEVLFLGPDGLINQAFIDGAGDAAEGAYITFAGLPPSALTGAGATWASTMEERLGHSPDAYAVYAFDCAVLTVQAIDQVGEKDRAAILDAMFNTEGFVGLVATYSITETGDTDATTMSLNVVENGKIVFQEDIGV